MQTPIILATANMDKVREFRQILPETYTIITMQEAGFCESIEENGSSFIENALIKARAVHKKIGGMVLADDSGLSVDVLDGAPGLYSARFAGEAADYPTKIALLHQWLKPWPPSQWQASFICAIALVLPDGSEQTVLGECRGMIAAEPRGDNGFGYDPIFLLPDGSCTMAELPDDEKNRISHRGIALRKMADILAKRA